MRNERRKALVTGALTSRPQIPIALAGQPDKRQRCHQEIEVYHQLYKEKISKLTEEALANDWALSDTDEIGSETNNESHGSNSNEHGKSSQENKARKKHRMKILREVRQQTWAEETPEVKEEIRQVLEKEKENKKIIEATIADNEKTGLERSAEQRQ